MALFDRSFPLAICRNHDRYLLFDKKLSYRGSGGLRSLEALEFEKWGSSLAALQKFTPMTTFWIGNF